MWDATVRVETLANGNKCGQLDFETSGLQLRRMMLAIVKSER